MLRVDALLQAPAIASDSSEMPSLYYLSKYISKGSTDDKRIQIQYMKDFFTICMMDSRLPSITLATDRKWLEITESRARGRGQPVEDNQNIAASLFHARLHMCGCACKRTRREREGRLPCRWGMVYVVEFQKRGPPHAHVAIFTTQHFGCAP
jgi:hypothetical protein